jgi:putative hemolysin
MKNKRGSIIIVLLIVILLIVFGIYYLTEKFNIDTKVTINLDKKNDNLSDSNDSESDLVKIGNPATENCVEKGYEIERRISQTNGEYIVCIDSFGNYCDEWEYYRGECELE